MLVKKRNFYLHRKKPKQENNFSINPVRQTGRLKIAYRKSGLYIYFTLGFTEKQHSKNFICERTPFLDTARLGY